MPPQNDTTIGVPLARTGTPYSAVGVGGLITLGDEQTSLANAGDRRTGPHHHNVDPDAVAPIDRICPLAGFCVCTALGSATATHLTTLKI